MDDTGLLRHAIAISADAVAHGNHPFGALLASPSGEVLLTAENTVVTERDVTGHAETNLVRLASRTLAPADLAAASLYTSCEPCAMCTGALYWAGIGRLVFAMSEADLREMTGAHPDNPTLALPCRDVLAAGSRRTPVEVVGPLIADEATVHHAGFWG
ncbi:nucleoside deaminase [Nocardioides lianchengensis]|uniref:tRNA(Arg) A34 adenosine deaminase TadA n=1 Tax=Nocardioides lianchengensis TaxID=1045774 RepID=A0A1G6M3W0_9ACTN|nr:nucleoside deaminase [Nocardioides lianchengensis]NYG12361.1 tRNA(Arg) A34 adenosine deaminase TadA [Nocardioides lianchengensis]SDC50150.1 tRNA(Arg) A34 adenosine deaminase TadA [Nocardioides lianchengensis]